MAAPFTRFTSLFFTEVRDSRGRVKHRSRRSNLRTTAGIDWQALQMGGGVLIGSAASGTATTAPTATTVTLDGVSAPGSTSAYTGHIITMGAGYGVVLSNTNAAPPVLTIDRWNDPTNPANTVATPAAGRWQILPASAPLWWLALTADSAAPAVGDTTLTSEITTGGLARALGTYAHTGGASSFTISKTFTASGTFTVNKEAEFTAQNGGTMPFESAEPNPPTLVSGDQLTQTVTNNI